jgi:hypothetical protein
VLQSSPQPGGGVVSITRGTEVPAGSILNVGNATLGAAVPVTSMTYGQTIGQVSNNNSGSAVTVYATTAFPSAQ